LDKIFFSSNCAINTDDSFLRAKYQREERGGLSETELLIQRLELLTQEDPGASIVVGKGANDAEIASLFIQTSAMKRCMTDYGRIVMMDHTYKINKNRMPVCVFMVMDGHGNGRVVGYAFVANEQLTTTRSVVRTFKEECGEAVVQRIDTVVIDKCPSEIGAVQLELPHVNIQLCEFHVIRVHNERTSKENPHVRTILEDLRRRDLNDEEWRVKVEELKKFASKTFFEYFDQNWLQCPQAWANRDKKRSINFGILTTNRVESHNQKMKQVNLTSEKFQLFSTYGMGCLTNFYRDGHQKDLKTKAEDKSKAAPRCNQAIARKSSSKLLLRHRIRKVCRIPPIL